MKYYLYIPLMALSLLSLISTLPAQEAVSPNETEVAHDKWQRRLEVGGYMATVFTVGCGTDLLARRKGDPDIEQNYQDMDISYDFHHTAHATGTAIATSFYLVSGYHLFKTNQQRKVLEFRHKAHNALFLATVAGLATSGITGMLCSRAYADGNEQKGHDLADVMQKVGNATMTIGLADSLLFGRKDNATIIGIKIKF